jgi:integrase
MHQHVDAKRKGRTAEEYARTLRLHVLPSIGSKRIIEVRRADVARLHRGLAARPYQANKALAVVSAIWNWAARRDEVAAGANPASGIERFPEQGRERFLTTEELGRLGDVLAEGENVGLPYAIDETNPRAKHAPKADKRRVKLDAFAAAAVRLLILTGARLREILDARREQIDLERGILFLPDSKTGRKPVYLSAAARAVIGALPRIDGIPHLIAGAKEGRSRADLKKPCGITPQSPTQFARLRSLRLPKTAKSNTSKSPQPHGFRVFPGSSRTTTKTRFERPSLRPRHSKDDLLLLVRSLSHRRARAPTNFCIIMV